MGLVDTRCVVQSSLGDPKTPPKKFRDCLFRLVPQQRYTAQRHYWKECRQSNLTTSSSNPSSSQHQEFFSGFGGVASVPNRYMHNNSNSNISSSTSNESSLLKKLHSVAELERKQNEIESAKCIAAHTCVQVSFISFIIIINYNELH